MHGGRVGIGKGLLLGGWDDVERRPWRLWEDAFRATVLVLRQVCLDNFSKWGILNAGLLGRVPGSRRSLLVHRPQKRPVRIRIVAYERGTTVEPYCAEIHTQLACFSGACFILVKRVGARS